MDLQQSTNLYSLYMHWAQNACCEKNMNRRMNSTMHILYITLAYHPLSSSHTTHTRGYAHSESTSLETHTARFKKLPESFERLCLPPSAVPGKLQVRRKFCADLAWRSSGLDNDASGLLSTGCLFRALSDKLLAHRQHCTPFTQCFSHFLLCTLIWPWVYDCSTFDDLVPH